MNIKNRVELKLENFEKCSFSCDYDLPLGSIYDYSCALQSFVVKLIQEAEDAKKAASEKHIEQEVKEEPKEV